MFSSAADRPRQTIKISNGFGNKEQIEGGVGENPNFLQFEEVVVRL